MVSQPPYDEEHEGRGCSSHSIQIDHLRFNPYVGYLHMLPCQTGSPVSTTSNHILQQAGLFYLWADTVLVVSGRMVFRQGKVISPMPPNSWCQITGCFPSLQFIWLQNTAIFWAPPCEMLDDHDLVKVMSGQVILIEVREDYISQDKLKQTNRCSFFEWVPLFDYWWRPSISWLRWTL